MHDFDKLRLQTICVAHQPLHTPPETVHRAVEQHYEPLLEALSAHPGARATLHFGGHLLDILARHHEAFLLKVKELRQRGRIEVLGGLFYGGLVSHLPELDVRGQIEMAREFWESFIGETPAGFWLAELAWAPELPRLFFETGLSYGFVSDTQLRLLDSKRPSLGCVERAGLTSACFVLNAAASSALPAKSTPAWLDALCKESPGTLTSVWLRAESLAQAPGGAAAFFAAIEAHAGVEPVLPADSFKHERPMPAALLVREQVAPELKPALFAGCQFGDFAAAHPQVAMLQRRILRCSQKLRDAIAVMEDEQLEPTWSDTLATAQRLVFAAQSPDAMWQREGAAGFADVGLRDAVLQRVLQAEAMLDGLLQGDETWMGCEELDLDADLQDEMWVSTPTLALWVAPARGAQIYALDHRKLLRTLLDAAAPGAHGICGTVVGPEMGPEGFFTQRLGAAWQPHGGFVTQNCGIDEDGDCSFRCVVRGKGSITPGGRGALEVQRRVQMPIDVPVIDIADSVRAADGTPGFWACQIPLRLGRGAHRLRHNGSEAPMPKDYKLAGVQTLTLLGDGELAVELHSPKPLDVWVWPVPGAEGVVLAPVVALGAAAKLSFSLRLTAT